MPKVRAAADIAKKWAQVTPGRADDYKLGVENPREDWARQTALAAPAYDAGVQEAIADKRFARGVEASGSDHWKNKTLKLGSTRWGPGVREAQADYEEGFTPFREVIERTALPPRAPRGDPRNNERQAMMSAALAQARKRR